MSNWYREIKGYKYQTTQEVVYKTGWVISRRENVSTDGGYVHLTGTGVLTISRGYCWDGASGPTFDTNSTMRASLVHDALYQLLREGELAPEYRLRADQCLKDIMLRDYTGNRPKFHKFRVSCWVWGLKRFAGYAAKPEE